MLADWIVDGHAPLDIPEVDPRRVMPFQTNRRYREARITETLDIAYDMHWPFQQREAARGIRRSPLHDRVAAAGAVFGEVAGWERANWYASAGVKRQEYSYSWGRPPWFGAWEREHQAVRQGVGLFDLSSFGKLLVQGRDAAAVLQRVSTSNVDVEPGSIVYTQWLNERGGIEADVTVTRWTDDTFMVMTAAATVVRDADWLRASHRTAGVRDGDGRQRWVCVAASDGTECTRVVASITDADVSDSGSTVRHVENH